MKLRIGTRKSALAKWQAGFVAKKINAAGLESEIIEIDSFGDLEKDLPIHKLGDKGVFTKALDQALLNYEIDLAVHSLKDVPTELFPGLFLAAVPRRGNPFDVLVKPLSKKPFEKPRVVATGSIRRAALWKNKFPGDEITGLRGNVPTRIDKVDNSSWYGAIFAYAGLNRLHLQDRVSEELKWMIPAPGQGALGIVAKETVQLQKMLTQLNHHDTRICVEVERAFLNGLGAGCSSPVGGFAKVRDEHLVFKGVVLSTDGSKRVDVVKKIPMEEAHKAIGVDFAKEVIDIGAGELIKEESNRV